MQPHMTCSSTSRQWLFQMFSIPLKSLFLSLLLTISLFNREIKSATSCHPIQRLTAVVPAFGINLTVLHPSTLINSPSWSLPHPSFSNGFLMILDTDFQVSLECVPCASFPWVTQYLPYCLAHPICCLSNPFSPPLPECILLNANQIVFLPWLKPFHPSLE